MGLRAYQSEPQGLSFMTRNSKTRRILQRSATTGSVLTGFVHGLAQIGSFGSVGSLTGYPKTDSADAIRGDWQRVGADLQRGFEKVRDREKTKAS
jgi:hypothetical protein